MIKGHDGKRVLAVLALQIDTSMLTKRFVFRSLTKILEIRELSYI